VINHLIHLPQSRHQGVRRHHRDDRCHGNQQRAPPVGEFQLVGGVLSFLFGAITQPLPLCTAQTKNRVTLTTSVCYLFTVSKLN